MKKILSIISIFVLLCGCGSKEPADIMDDLEEKGVKFTKDTSEEPNNAIVFLEDKEVVIWIYLSIDDNDVISNVGIISFYPKTDYSATGLVAFAGKEIQPDAGEMYNEYAITVFNKKLGELGITLEELGEVAVYYYNK
ncbi:MAG: hypothetical protein ACK5LF_25390 [Bacteroides xylanisolvens]